MSCSLSLKCVALALSIAGVCACASEPPADKYGPQGGTAGAPAGTGSAAAGGAGVSTPPAQVPSAGTAGASNTAGNAGSRATGAGGSSAAGSGGQTAAGAPAEPPKAAPGYLTTRGAKLYDSQGREARITGVSWFGMEGGTFAPFGLSNQSLGTLLDTIVKLGFNTLRLPFCNQLFDAGSRPNVDASRNPDLAGKTGLQLMDAIVKGAAERGLKVMLDRHRPDANAQSDLWYTDRYSEQRWIDDWKMLATRYKDDPTVFAVDLHNEPKGDATWGDGNQATDWKAAAERAGNAILAINPNLLIVVEGIEKIGADYYWWGGQLAAAGDKPVKLAVDNRVVYSAHDYPASLYPQPWFSAADYPANLAKVWSDHWGYLAERDIAPVFVGEFGTKFETESDKQWLGALTKYIDQHKLSFAFWCLNPNSGDTGGLLQGDWQTENKAKLDVLRPIQAARIE